MARADRSDSNLVAIARGAYIAIRNHLPAIAAGAALFALASPLSKGVLLADEVGLGKTIEASLVIAQRWAEHRRRVLLIVPASLRKQQCRGTRPTTSGRT